MTPELEEFLRVELGYSISKLYGESVSVKYDIRELEKCWQAAFLAGCKYQREVDAVIAREYRVGFRGGWLEQICVDIANKILKGGEGE